MEFGSYLSDSVNSNSLTKWIYDRIIFWHKYIHPILIDNQVFYDWLFYCLPRIQQYKENTPYNLSDITFGMDIKGKKINSGRFGIGTFDLSSETFWRFRNLLINFGGRNAYFWYQRALRVGDVIGLALAVDIPEKLKKFYIYYSQENPRISSIAVDWRTGNIVENRVYRAINNNGDVEKVGNQKGVRIQRNFTDKLKGFQIQIKFIRCLPINNAAKKIAERIIRFGYNLDTFAFGKNGRVALYFE